jgi:hypothetical protein
VIDIGTYVHNTYACDIWARQDPIGPALGPHRSRNGMGLLGNPTQMGDILWSSPESSRELSEGDSGNICQGSSVNYLQVYE